jgi:hypothetical protein
MTTLRATAALWAADDPLIVLALVPALVAGTVAEERSRRTLPGLLAARLSSAAIILDKSWAASLPMPPSPGSFPAPRPAGSTRPWTGLGACHRATARLDRVDRFFNKRGGRGALKIASVAAIHDDTMALRNADRNVCGTCATVAPRVVMASRRHS